MKAVIYAGAGLFTIASIYGVADYYNSDNNGSLKTLYEEETAVITKAAHAKVPLVAYPIEERTDIAVREAEKTKAGDAFSKKIFKKFSFDDFSRGRIVERIPEPAVIEPIQPLEQSVQPSAVVSEPAVPVERPVEVIATEEKVAKKEAVKPLPVKE